MGHPPCFFGNCFSWSIYNLPQGGYFFQSLIELLIKIRFWTSVIKYIASNQSRGFLTESICLRNYRHLEANPQTPQLAIG